MFDAAYENISINLHMEKVTVDNIMPLLRKYKVPIVSVSNVCCSHSGGEASEFWGWGRTHMLCRPPALLFWRKCVIMESILATSGHRYSWPCFSQEMNKY